MRLRFKDLTDSCRALGLDEYESHAVPGLVTEDGEVALCTFLHRRGKGTKTLENRLIEYCGGTRIEPPNSNDALCHADGCLLSAMMTKKFAAMFGDSELALGGGKTIVFTHNIPEILGDVRINETRQELWRVYAEEILARIGAFLTSVDMGITREDLEYIARYAPFGTITGQTGTTYPSPIAAQGLRLALEETWRRYGDNGDDMQLFYEKQSFALQGLGNVGRPMLNILWDCGARKICVSEPIEDRVREALREKNGIRIVDNIYSVPATVFLPCAKGGVLNKDTIAQMKFSIIVGSANNPLAERYDGIRLYRRGIIYSPAEGANAGGAIKALCDAKGMDVMRELIRIPNFLRRVYEESDIFDDAPSEVANKITRDYVEKLRPATLR